MEKPQESYRYRTPPPHPPFSSSGGGGGGTIIASCALAAAFIILLSLALTLSFFLLFRPRDPQIHISSLNLPHFSPSLNATAPFYFSQYASVRNPNRAAFSHYDSSLQLLSAGAQIGFMYIPAGEIAAGQTVYMSASFPVNSFPFAAAAAGGVVEVESRMRVKGRVRVLMYFTHHIEASAGCKVGISSSDGSVLGYRC